MPEAPTTIVPPTPTITQGESVNDSVLKAFDRVMPEVRGTPKPPTPPAPVTPPPTPPEPSKAEEPVTPVDKAQPEEKKDASKVPSFIEEVLSGETVKSDKAAAGAETGDGEFPEELPAFKTPEESKSRYKQWRSSYQKLKAENLELKSRPTGLDEVTAARFTAMDQANKEMSGTLARLGVEQHQDFQNNVIRPLHGAWNEAARIVKEAGGDPNDLSRAMALRGKAHFEALDSLMESFPESAKGELRDAVREFRRVDGVRQKALAEAPKTFQALREKDMREQMQVLEKQRQEMSSAFDDAVKTLRDEGKLEVLLTGDGDEAKEWNANVQRIIDRSKDILFKNTDMKKMAMAAILANSADSYRRLWLSAEARARKLEGINNDKFSREPVLGGSADSSVPPEAKLKEDLNKPFSAVFIETLRKQRAAK